MANCCRIKARKECHQIHALKKNHSGECKSARVEFESVDVICEKIQAKSEVLCDAYFIFSNKDLSTDLTFPIYTLQNCRLFFKNKKPFIHFLFSKKEEKKKKKSTFMV